MIVSGCAGSFVAPGSCGSEGTESPRHEVVMHLGFGGNSAVVLLVFLSVFGVLLELFLVLTIPIFLYILQRGQFSLHLHHFAFGGAAALGVGHSCAWGSIFMDCLELVGVKVLLVGGISQSFLNLKGSLRFFLPQAMGCKCELGHFLMVGGYSLEYLLLKASDPLDSVGP